MKIPFEATISGAYRFAFTNILSIIGIVWFPALVLFALVGGLIYVSLPEIHAFVDSLSQIKDKAPAPPMLMPAVFALMGRYVLLIFVVVLFQAMVNVGVMRKALGQHPGPVFFYFSLGSQVWRLIGSYFLLGLMAYGAAIGFGLVVAALGFGLGKALPDNQALVWLIAGLAALVALCWAVYAIVRVLFFIPAVVVAENHIGIRRSWHLGRGNFWRIVGTYLIVTVPLAVAINIVVLTAVQMVAGPGGIDFPVGNDPAAAAAYFKHLGMVIVTLAPVLVVVQVVAMILRTGLVNGAIGIAYNKVTGNEVTGAEQA